MNNDEATQDELKWEARANTLMVEGSFEFAGVPSSYDEMVALSYEQIHSFEDFENMISAMVMLHDAAMHSLGYDSPEKVLAIIAEAQAEMSNES